jgi:threonine/homoserine/homoserine lactone efflux protein
MLVPLKLILFFAATELLVTLTPGPAVFLIISQGMKAGFKPSLSGVLGIETGNISYFALSALGIGAVLAASPNLFTIIKWVGAVYLTLMGIKMLFSRPVRTNGEQPDPASSTSFTMYIQGVVTQLTNPRALIFFTAILPQFISPGAHLTIQFVMLGLVSILVEIPVLSAYGWLASKGGRLISPKFATLPDRIAGTFLIAAGAGLALMRRQ